MDLPQVPTQRPLPLPRTSVLVTGPPGSGRSTALRAIARRWAERGAELMVLDTGGALESAGLPQATRTLLGPADAALWPRAVELLHRLLGRPDSPVPVVLVIDGLDALTSSVDAADYGTTTARLAELISSGPGRSVIVTAAADPRTAHLRIASGFGSRIVLSVDRRGAWVRSPPGRGWSEGQAVQLIDEPAAARLRPGDPVRPSTTDRGRPARTGGRAPLIRPLPGDGSVELLPPARPDAVPVGWGGDDAGPVCLDLAGPAGGVLVAGPRSSGVTVALTVVVLGAMSAGIPVVWIGGGRPPPGTRSVGRGSSPADLLQAMAEHPGPLLLVVDDLEDDDPLAQVLHGFLTAGGAGRQLLAGTRLDRALRSRRGLISEAASFRRGLLLQAEAADGWLLDAQLPRRRGLVRPGRGHLIRPGTTTPIQIAYPSGPRPMAGE